jgi:hypothetical protein
MSYLLSILSLLALIAGIWFVLRLLRRVFGDVVGVISYIWAVKKNNSELKKYNDEKLKNLERERQQRIQKQQQQMAELDLTQDEGEVLGFSIEPPPKEHRWSRRLFERMIPALRQMTLDPKGTVGGKRGLRLFSWRAFVVSQRGGRGQDKGGGGRGF